MWYSVEDPGFPGRRPHRWGRLLPKQLRFENFVCRNERIWTLKGDMHRAHALDPPMVLYLCVGIVGVWVNNNDTLKRQAMGICLHPKGENSTLSIVTLGETLVV